MSPDKIYSDIVNSASAAKAHYEIWWALVNRAKPALIGALNKHPDFFLASSDAHYTSFFVYFAHLFDKNPQTSSIQKYLNAINPTTNSVTLQAWKDRLKEFEERTKPLTKVRHNAVAHINAKLTEQDVFEPLNITWDEVRAIIYDVASFVKELNPNPPPEGVGYIGIPRDERLIEATIRLLQDIHKQPA